MLLFDFSDDQVKVIRLTPKILGGEALDSYNQIPLKSNLVVRRQAVNPADLAKELKDGLEKAGLVIKSGESCALSLHDERVFALRLKVDRTSDGGDILKLVDTQVETFIPEKTSEIVKSFKPAPEDSSGEVQLIAADKNLITGYKEVFKALGLNLVLLVPESYALYQLVAPLIGLKETVVFLNREETAADFIEMDKEGVLATFTGSPSAVEMENKLTEIIEFMEKRWARKITKLWLGGSSAAGGEALAKKFNLEAVKVEVAFSRYPLNLGAKIAEAQRSEIAHLLGLALLTRQKDALSLVNPV